MDALQYEPFQVKHTHEACVKSSMSLGMVVALSREIAVKFSYTIEHVLSYNICHYLGYGVVYLSIIIIRCISTLVVKNLQFTSC